MSLFSLFLFPIASELFNIHETKRDRKKVVYQKLTDNKVHGALAINTQRMSHKILMRKQINRSAFNVDADEKEGEKLHC